MTGPATGTAGNITARRAECTAAISRLAEHPTVDAKTMAQLRRELGGELATLVASTAALQQKARKKLGSGTWWVTEKSLQQATPWQVARLKATWQSDLTTYDLCCGIGGDAIQLVKRGQVVAIDADATLAEMAALNLALSGATSKQAQAICGDATTIDLPSHAAVHIDPDRRAGGGRSSRPDHYLPAWPDVLRIVAKTEHAVVKLAPAAKLDAADIPASHRCWVSLGGSVREQSLLSGAAVDHAELAAGAKSAVSLASDGSACWFKPSVDDLAANGLDICGKPLSVLVDPDASIRAAGLTETFARRYAFRILGSPSGFLTCDDPGLISSSATQMVVAGNVIWSGPCDDRKLRKELRNRGVYPDVIKVRGTDHDPAMLAKRYRKCGDEPVTVWISRANSRVFAAITRPLAN